MAKQTKDGFFEIALLEKPGVEGLTRDEVMELHDMLSRPEAFPVEIGDVNGNSSAMGFITPEAAEELQYKYDQFSDLGQFISAILDDCEKESDDGTYAFQDLRIWLGRNFETEERDETEEIPKNVMVVYEPMDSETYRKALLYWSSAAGDLHKHGKEDITEEELPEPLRKIYDEIWEECPEGLFCYLAEHDGVYGIALQAEYHEFSDEGQPGEPNNGARAEFVAKELLNKFSEATVILAKEVGIPGYDNRSDKATELTLFLPATNLTKKSFSEAVDFFGPIAYVHSDETYSCERYYEKSLQELIGERLRKKGFLDIPCNVDTVDYNVNDEVCKHTDGESFVKRMIPLIDDSIEMERSYLISKSEFTIQVKNMNPNDGYTSYIIEIQEGSGDNLLQEDMNKGFCDYIDYTARGFSGKEQIFEDGGMVLLKSYFEDLSQEEVIRLVMEDMEISGEITAYAKSIEEAVRLVIQ